MKTYILRFFGRRKADGALPSIVQAERIAADEEAAKSSLDADYLDISDLQVWEKR